MSCNAHAVVESPKGAPSLRSGFRLRAQTPAKRLNFVALSRDRSLALPQDDNSQGGDGRSTNSICQPAGTEGLLPFCIEWSADSPHPADDAPSGLRLVQFEISSPNPDELQRTLDILGLDLQVTRSDRPQLRARVVGPQGTADLTS